MRKKWIIPAALLTVVLALSTYGFAATSGVFDLNLVAATRIQAPAGATATGGKIAKVEWMGETVERPVGKKATKIAGVDLFKITLIDSSLSDDIVVELAWLDPQNAGQVLNNPHSYIRARVYYVNSSCAAADQRLVTVTTTNDTIVCPTTYVDDFGEVHITKRAAVRRLMPTTTSQGTLYVLGDIVVPGGVPAGQQATLSSFDFYAEARKR